MEWKKGGRKAPRKFWTIRGKYNGGIRKAGRPNRQKKGMEPINWGKLPTNIRGHSFEKKAANEKKKEERRREPPRGQKNGKKEKEHRPRKKSKE